MSAPPPSMLPADVTSQPLTQSMHRLTVVVPLPAYSALPALLTYVHDVPLPAGQLVWVPLGKREVMGVVWDTPTQSLEAMAPQADTSAPAAPTLKPITAVAHDVPLLDAAWRSLVQLTSQYYQRSLGEVALAALPTQLRQSSPAQIARFVARLDKRWIKSAGDARHTSPTVSHAPPLSPEQALAAAAIQSATSPVLLFGRTGSGKTEVYFDRMAQVLSADASAQVLFMVPEINLTPQLEALIHARFAPLVGEAAMVSLHSGMTPAERLTHWLLAAQGRARIVLGTRLSVFTPMPHLQLIVVDEEHDASYKAQDGARYSARDLAIARAAGLQNKAVNINSIAANPIGTGGKPCQVILGSATPSLESWHASRPKEEGGRYLRVTLNARIGNAPLPQVKLVNLKQHPPKTLISEPLLAAMQAVIGAGQQVMVLLNQRGYAPVLHCLDCGWKSECPHCSAYRVFHKVDRTLRCHHCGFRQSVPKQCPSCGNLDIHPVGRGTELLQEELSSLFAPLRRPDGSSVRVGRIDADTTAKTGELATQLAAMHAGDIDVLVGTQMIAKGHDFQRIALVVALNPDGALFAPDYRASERLFALLTQAAGRAGRAVGQVATSELWVQTHHADHPLFAALKAHDFERFAKDQLHERRIAQLPPFAHCALLRAEAKTQQAAQAFLQAAIDAIHQDEALAAMVTPPSQAIPHDAPPDARQETRPAPHVNLYSPVPMHMAKIADIERAQLLIDSTHRPLLQHFLSRLSPLLRHLHHGIHHKTVLRWSVEVDPLSV